MSPITHHTQKNATTAHVTEKMYLNALAHIPGIGACGLRSLVEIFGSAYNAWHSSDSHLLEKTTLSQTVRTSWCSAKKPLNPEQLWQKILKNTITIVTFAEEDYPEKLGTIPNPPALLYVRGTPDFTASSVAIVGARAHTDYGKQCADFFAQELSHTGVTIVSGLALGIDAIAHEGALASHGHTIGVLAGGIDNASITPRSNHILGTRILERGGALISEYPPGTQPHRGTFPARNRIMAGLCDATLVIEAQKKSGTLITAGYAQKFNRALFTVPGKIFSQTSDGSNALVCSGDARLATHPDDILSAIAPQKKRSAHTAATHARRKKYVPHDATEKEILAVIACHPDGVHVDRIKKNTTLKTITITTTLTLLEINGAVVDTGGQYYRCA